MGAIFDRSCPADGTPGTLIVPEKSTHHQKYPQLPDRPSGKSLRAWLLLLTFVLLGFGADLASKSIAFARVAGQPVEIDRSQVIGLTSQGRDLTALLPFHEPVKFLPHVLEFQLVLNKGAVFGLGGGQRWVFIVFTVVAIVFGLVAFGRWTHERDWLAQGSIALVLAGGLGNVYDRIRFACVRDFLHPLPGVKLPFGLHWPGDTSGYVWPWVSNVADLLLILGVLGLLITMWRIPKPAQKSIPKAKPEPAAPKPLQEHEDTQESEPTDAAR